MHDSEEALERRQESASHMERYGEFMDLMFCGNMRRVKPSLEFATAKLTHDGRKYLSSAAVLLLRRPVCSSHRTNAEKHLGGLEHARKISPKQFERYLRGRMTDRY